jgi:hypothetical protein
LEGIDRPNRARCGSRRSDIVRMAQTRIGLPVHPFRLSRKIFEHVSATAQLHSNFLSPSEPAKTKTFSLACVCQSVATPTREELTGSVEQRNTASAESSIGADITAKPCAITAEMTSCPNDWHYCSTDFHSPAPVFCNLNFKTTASALVCTLMLPINWPPQVHEH